MAVVLGALVLIGAFVFWCDLTDSWSNVFRRNTGALLRPVPQRPQDKRPLE
jgi:hypothetical protein